MGSFRVSRKEVILPPQETRFTAAASRRRCRSECAPCWTRRTLRERRRRNAVKGRCARPCEGAPSSQVPSVCSDPVVVRSPPAVRHSPPAAWRYTCTWTPRH
ncbi:uncharacterized protein LOC135100013 [Scylla paramamosain]|uniref:uncharacterized protein LOC135100013 n=1 Tax=Scylla paramamosain TaxID=85552 RepID=UPI0030829564